MSARKDRVSFTPLLIVGLGLLLMVVSLVWFVNSNQAPAASEVDLPSPVATSNIPEPDIMRVALDEAKSAFDQKQAVFIDVRGEPYYSQGHIPGSLSLTNDEVLSRLDELDPNAWYITYCT